MFWLPIAAINRLSKFASTYRSHGFVMLLIEICGNLSVYVSDTESSGVRLTKWVVYGSYEMIYKYV